MSYRTTSDGRVLFLLSLAALIPAMLPVAARAQAAKSDPDVVTFPDGEKVIGHFESVSGNTAKFKSDTLGEITIDLTKVQELRASGKFAVVRKNVKLGRGEHDGQIPVGTIAVVGQTVQVAPDGKAEEKVAVADVSNIVDQATFDEAFQHSSILKHWTGAASLGASLVEATQNSVAVNTAISLVRAVPTQDWLPPRDRTIIDFSDSYGRVTQPNTPTVKTSIYHADAERDQYFTTRVYALGNIAFDHNFSQGLDLQQLYGGGLGWSVIHRDAETLDLKGTVDYEKQQFELASQNKNLIDSVFAEAYMRKFMHRVVLAQQLAVSPAWNDTKAYSAYGSIGLTFPVYKRFGFNVNLIDSFLNDPPPGFKKNSVQFATGLTYTLQ